MKPSEAISTHRIKILEIIARHDGTNPRIVGGAVRDEDAEDGDLYILIEPIAGKTTLLSLVKMEQEIADLLGLRVDVQTPLSLPSRIRAQIIRGSVPL